MRRPVLFSLCIVLLLSISAASTAISIGGGPVELNPDEFVNITPVNSTETYEVPQATVLGALDAASILGVFEYQVAEDLPLEEGNLSILSIAGIENEMVNETQNNWTYWVNGQQGTTGPAVTNVTDGDNLTYSYGPPSHTLENASYTLTVNVSVLEAAVNVTPTPTVNVTPGVNVTPTPTVNVTPGANVTPAVNVSDQPIVNATVIVDNATINRTGWADIHADLNGTPGAIIGYSPIVEGVNENVTVEIEVENATPVLYAMLHVDEGEPGVHEFPGPDMPVLLNGSPVQQAFNVTGGLPGVNVTPTPTVNVTPGANVTPTPTVNVTPTPTPGVNITNEIAAGLSGQENLTTFVGIVNNSTLGERLDENRSYVVCAPTNDAFAAVGNETLSVILNDTTLLNSILDYHVIQGDYTIEELVMLCQNSTDGQISLPTVAGTNVNVSLIDSQLIINDIVVITQIQITNNIIVYVIDGVLIPPEVPVPTPTPTPTMNVTPTPTMNVTPTPTMPGQETIDLELYEGWNFVSIPRQLSAGNDTAASVFGDVDTDGRPIYTFTSATGFTPLGENETLEVLEGYWVYSTEDTTVQLNLSTNPVRAPAMKTLTPGWNAIGYSDLTERTADEALTSVEDSWVYVVGFDAANQSYRPALINNQTGAQGENQRLSPTEGYWLFMGEDGRLAAIST